MWKRFLDAISWNDLLKYEEADNLQFWRKAAIYFVYIFLDLILSFTGDAVGKGHRVSAAVVRGREFLWPVVEHVRGHNSFHL